jgi:hypothetical protein
VNDLIFQAITFGGGAVEVSYVEERDAEGPINEMRTLVIPGELVADELAEVHDALQQLVDKALLVRRSPPDRVRHAR